MKKNHCNFDLEKRYKVIFEKTKTKNITELENFLINLKKKAKLETNFAELGININQDISKIITGVNLLRLKNNPIKLDKRDLKDIILKEPL